MLTPHANIERRRHARVVGVDRRRTVAAFDARMTSLLYLDVHFCPGCHSRKCMDFPFEDVTARQRVPGRILKG